jgi:hypothetical protein
MFRKIPLTALALASAVALAPNANASTATATVSFSGTVASSCTFGNPTPGTLGSLYSSSSTNIGYMFSGTGYASGSVTLTCNTSSSLSVSDPTNNGSSAGASTPTNQNSVLVMFPNGDVCYNSALLAMGSTNSPTCSSIAAGTNTLSVDMSLNFSSPPTAGTYNYSTTLTATYN